MISIEKIKVEMFFLENVYTFVYYVFYILKGDDFYIEYIHKGVIFF